MCGSNLESENGFASYDLQEMLDASTGSNVSFIVQTGGSPIWHSNIDADVLGRYEICNGEFRKLDVRSLASMGSANTLAEFLIWGLRNYPAGKMGFIFWNHGGGSNRGVCVDDIADGDRLILPEIRSALADVSQYMTDKFEFIGFDACLMGTVEVANTVASYARYLYSSEEIEPGCGWYDTPIGDYLGKNPKANGAELGKVLTDSYYSFCQEVFGETNDLTFSVIDLSKLDNVITCFNEYSKNLYEATSNKDVLADVVRKIYDVDNYGCNNPEMGYYNMVDLAGLAEAGSKYADGADKLQAASCAEE